MIKTVIVCDRCKKQYDESNGWYCLAVEPGSDDSGTERLVIMEFADAKRHDAFHDYWHVCGRECLIQAISQWLEKRRPSQ